ncbi:hypothetical protein [Microbacterium sp. H83]|uniref:hypothetical protein n=1 Tax=Microbacterium sp. H83 TaxID=1827324 RepID=UPI0007F44334|nr:hypothetical protein [Microbacterium sp. H83]OAN35234.1 hypothetical protein A4X16_05130 [Microbacterium sp. H83]
MSAAAAHDVPRPADSAVPACAFGGVLLGQLIAGASTGEAVGSAVVAALGSIVHVGFWVTVGAVAGFCPIVFPVCALFARRLRGIGWMP